MSLPKGYESLQAELDAQLKTLEDQIRPLMDTYVAKGWYWQGIQTCEVDAAKDGALVDQDATKAAVYDPAATWDNFGVSLPSKLKMAVAVDNYDGPKGKDWAIRAHVEIQGFVYTRLISGLGVEAPESDWYLMLNPLDKLAGPINADPGIDNITPDAIP